MKNTQIVVRWEDPFLVCELPKVIKNEIREWVQYSKKVKNNPFSALKAHENVGYLSDKKNQNSYQCSIPLHMIEQSFWLPYTLRLCAHHYGDHHKNYSIRHLSGHFDSSDVWTNFSYKGNGNEIHNHSGHISGVIYFKNRNHPTKFPYHQKEYCGKDGTMILFTSDIGHCVDPQPYRGERITLGFNITRQQFPIS